MLASMSNTRILLLIFCAMGGILTMSGFLIRHYILRVEPASKDILWVIAFQICAACGLTSLIEHACPYLNVYEVLVNGAPTYCTLPRYFWGGIVTLAAGSLFVIVWWLVRSPFDSLRSEEHTASHTIKRYRVILGK